MIGILCSLVSFIYITFIKPHLKYDDPLDAFGCHGVSGIIGSILVGFFATAKVNSNIHENGLFYGDGWHLLGIQLGGTLFTIIFVAIMTWGCAKLITLIIPMRVSKQAEDVASIKANTAKVLTTRSGTFATLNYTGMNLKDS